MRGEDKDSILQTRLATLLSLLIMCVESEITHAKKNNQVFKELYTSILTIKKRKRKKKSQHFYTPFSSLFTPIKNSNLQFANFVRFNNNKFIDMQKFTRFFIS